jgi:hypothetical protein
MHKTLSTSCVKPSLGRLVEEMGNMALSRLEQLSETLDDIVRTSTKEDASFAEVHIALSNTRKCKALGQNDRATAIQKEAIEQLRGVAEHSTTQQKPTLKQTATLEQHQCMNVTQIYTGTYQRCTRRRMTIRGQQSIFATQQPHSTAQQKHAPKQTTTLQQHRNTNVQ